MVRCGGPLASGLRYRQSRPKEVVHDRHRTAPTQPSRALVGGTRTEARAGRKRSPRAGTPRPESPAHAPPRRGPQAGRALGRWRLTVRLARLARRANRLGRARRINNGVLGRSPCGTPRPLSLGCGRLQRCRPGPRSGRAAGARRRATDARLASASAIRQQRRLRYRVPCKAVAFHRRPAHRRLGARGAAPPAHARPPTTRRS